MHCAFLVIKLLYPSVDSAFNAIAHCSLVPWLPDLFIREPGDEAMCIVLMGNLEVQDIVWVFAEYVLLIPTV
jgi:hypothetical protein